MKLPFTVGQFLANFASYNTAVWPAQFVLAFGAIAAILLAYKRLPYSAKYISLVLAGLWCWMGIVYHFVFFSAINKLAWLFGAAFVLQGLLFLVNGFFRDRFSFAFRPNIDGIAGGLMMVFALVIYPLISYHSGHIYPSTPTFGLPCPTTIFTFGILLWMKGGPPVYILIIPLLWAIVGFSAAFSLGIKEDIGLLVAGVVAMVLLLTRNHKRKTSPST